ncbi:MAG TPA: hypothetical protein VFO16_01640 [Pseudonocardiaceae bacterium]|nr:hypothetical protein [Pseudonocardiaceae bacterium]
MATAAAKTPPTKPFEALSVLSGATTASQLRSTGDILRGGGGTRMQVDPLTGRVTTTAAPVEGLQPWNDVVDPRLLTPGASPIANPLARALPPARGEPIGTPLVPAPRPGQLALPAPSGPPRIPGTILGAPSGAQLEPLGPSPTRTVDPVTGKVTYTPGVSPPGGPPRIAQSTIAPEDTNELIRTLGAQLQSGLENAPPPGPPGMTPTTRARYQEQQGYRDAVVKAGQDIAGELRDIVHQPGRTEQRATIDSVTGERGTTSIYHPPLPGASVYWDIVGRGNESAPSRTEIAQLVDAWITTKARSGADLAKHPEFEARWKAFGGKTGKALTNAYDRWLPQIQSAIDTRARQYVDAAARSKAAWDDYLRRREEGGGRPTVTGTEQLPDWVLGEEPTTTPLRFDPETKTFVGGEQPPPPTEGWDPDLEGPPGGPGEPGGEPGPPVLRPPVGPPPPPSTPLGEGYSLAPPEAPPARPTGPSQPTLGGLLRDFFGSSKGEADLQALAAGFRDVQRRMAEGETLEDAVRAVQDAYGGAAFGNELLRFARAQTTGPELTLRAQSAKTGRDVYSPEEMAARAAGMERANEASRRAREDLHVKFEAQAAADREAIRGVVGDEELAKLDARRAKLPPTSEYSADFWGNARRQIEATGQLAPSFISPRDIPRFQEGQRAAETEPTLPGLEAVREAETPTPAVAPLPEQQFNLAPPTLRGRERQGGLFAEEAPPSMPTAPIRRGAAPPEGPGSLFAEAPPEAPAAAAAAAPQAAVPAVGSSVQIEAGTYKHPVTVEGTVLKVITGKGGTPIGVRVEFTGKGGDRVTTSRSLDQIRQTPAAPAPAAPEPTAPEQPTEPGQGNLFSRFFTETEGSVPLSFPPVTRSGLKKWLARYQDDYGTEPWFKAAADAMENEDPALAWRIASMAFGQQASAAARRRPEEPGAKAPGAAGTPGVPPGARPGKLPLTTESPDAIERARAAHRKQIEKELGFPLPPTVDVSPEGILTFAYGGKGVPAVKARMTDLTYGTNIVRPLVEAADATKIVYAGRNAPSDIRVGAQIADQIARELADAPVVQDIMQLAGLDPTNPAHALEVGRQLRRTLSLWGKLGGQVGNWTKANMKDFYHLAGVNETGAPSEYGSVGALQGEGIRTPEGFVKWLGGPAATPERLKDLGFSFPSAVGTPTDAKGKLTKSAATYARNWMRRQIRQQETLESIVRLAKTNSAIDQMIVHTTIAPELGRGDEAPSLGREIQDLSRAALLTAPSTAVRNLWSQSLRYSTDILDDALAGGFAAITGNSDVARYHFREAANLTKAVFAHGTGSSAGLLAHPFADNLEGIYNYQADLVDRLGPNDARKSIAALHEFPTWAAHFLGSIGTEQQSNLSAQLRNVVNAATVLTRVQEHAFRAAAFHGTFRTQLERMGLDPNVEMAIGKTPRDLIQKLGVDKVERMVSASTAAALDKTFAANPYPGTIPDILMNYFSRDPIFAPLLQIGVPFPRFSFVTAPRWLWDHSVVGPLVDLPLYALSSARNDAGMKFRGRYYLMKEMEANSDILGRLDTDIATTEDAASQAAGEFLKAQVTAREANASLNAMHKRLSSGTVIPTLEADIQRVSEQLQEALTTSAAKRAEWRVQEARVKNLRTQRQTATKTATNLQMVGAAASPQEYWARHVTGAALFGAAYMLIASKSDPAASKWNEMPLDDVLKLAGADRTTHPQIDQLAPVNRNLDLRAYAPQVQPLLLADLVYDMAHHTDWSALRESYIDRTTNDPFRLTPQFFRDHYDGKYSGASFGKEFLNAYLSVSPAAGTTKTLLDALSGEGGGQGRPSLLAPGVIEDAFLTTIGQFVARYTAPLRVISDFWGEFSPEEAKVRIPETGTEETTGVGQLYEPTLANIPYARRLIPEKISPITGQPLTSVDPMVRQLAGVTQRVSTQIEQEANRINLPFAALVPRQTGDREYDNQVNKTYSQMLNDVVPELLADPGYQAMPYSVRRETVLIPTLNGLKKAAAASNYDDLVDKLMHADPAHPLDPESAEYKARLQQLGPAAQQRLRMLKQYVDKLDKESPVPPEPSEPGAEEPAAPPDLSIPEPPPPGPLGPPSLPTFLQP